MRRLPLSTQRLVNLAVALLGNPDFIIWDDPFSGMDKGECEHLISVLAYLHEMNHTTLLISGQDYSQLSRLASKYGVMADGKLICELTAGELNECCQRCIKIRTPQLERAIRGNQCPAGLFRDRGIRNLAGRYGADRLSFENDRRCKE